MTLSRYMAHVVCPMSEDARANDLQCWRALGTGTLMVFGLPHNDPRRCSANTKYGFPCELWGSLVIDGARYCQYHAPSGAERR